MPALGGADAGWLFIETVDQPITFPMLLPLSPRGGVADPQPLSLDQLQAHVSRRLPDIPVLRWRVVRAPLGLARPTFVEDPDFDLDYHVRQLQVPAPGGRAELDRLMADGMERRLDRRHPLWTLHLVNGLSGGQQALFLCFHHAMCDGGAVINVIKRLFSDPVDGRCVGSAPTGRIDAPRLPKSVRREVRRESLAQWRALKLLPGRIADTKRHFDALKAAVASSKIWVPEIVKDTPVCSLNNAFSGDRVLARTSIPLAELREVRRAAAVPFDAVAIALAAAAIRAYLLDHGDLPEKPLTANVPIERSTADAPERDWGNRFANYMVSMATDVADPWQRLLAIGSVAVESRRRLEILGAETIVRWLEYVPSALGDLIGRRLAAWRRQHRERADFSVLVSNVRGPSTALTFGSVQVAAMYVAGPPTDAEGVNFTAWNYCDNVEISISTHREAVADPSELIAHVRPALDELLAIARSQAATGAVGAGSA